MIDAHILDGDIVILEDRKDVQNGDIVAALIDGETTLKRYVTEHGRPYLKAENPLYPNLTPARELRSKASWFRWSGNKSAANAGKNCELFVGRI